MHYLWYIILGAVAGWLAGTIVKGGGFGLIGDIIVGILGGLVGGWLAGLLGIGSGGSILGSLVIATAGAIVLILLVRMIKKA